MYVFQEFPKWITSPDGKPIIVQSVEEESALIRKVPDEEINRPQNQSESANQIEDERALLILQAEAKGVKIDKRWGLAKIKTALEG